MNGFSVPGDRERRPGGKFGPKLTAAQVADVKTRLMGGEKSSVLAAEYGVHNSAVAYYRVRIVPQDPTLPDRPRSAPHRGQDLTWMDDADCRTVVGFLDLTVDAQRAVCGNEESGCPVLVQCRQFGIDHLDPYTRRSRGGPVHGGLVGKELEHLHALQAERERPMARWRGQRGART